MNFVYVIGIYNFSWAFIIRLRYNYLQLYGVGMSKMNFIGTYYIQHSVQER